MKAKMIAGAFFLINALIATISIIGSPDTLDFKIKILTLVFLLPFHVIGFISFKSGYKEWKERQNILKNGIKLTAKIIDYEDNHRRTDNGQPFLDLIITFDLYGKKKIARLATNTYNESKYPINSYIEIAYLSGKMLIV